MLNQNKPEQPIISVRTVISNTEGKFAMGRRAPGNEQAGCWEFPGGKIDDGEAPLSAALREPHEEIGVVVYPKSPLVPIGEVGRIIPDGKHAGRPYTALGCMAMARAPFDKLQAREDVDAVGWFTREEILNMPNLTVASRDAAEKLL
jgi:ADP-ribose pyrophosphatase YjhB (NUDIX family)